MAKLLYMVITVDNMQLAQLGKLEIITAKQFLENPEATIVTAPVSAGASYSQFSDDQLTRLAENVQCDVTGLNYGQKIQKIRTHIPVLYKTWPQAESEEYYESRIRKAERDDPERYAAFKPDVPVAPVRTVHAERAQSSTPKPSAPATRPAGGTTKKVWDIADGVREEHPTLSAKEIRPLIIAACEADGINGSTAGTQYSKWKNSVKWEA